MASNNTSNTKQRNNILMECVDELHNTKYIICAALALLDEYIEETACPPNGKYVERANYREYSVYYLLNGAIKKITANADCVQKIVRDDL